MSAPIDFYGANTGNSIRVAIALEEVSLEYEVMPLDLTRGEQKSRKFLLLNPEGQVPVIVDRSPLTGSVVVAQSNAIMLYLASKRPGVLLPESMAPRALAMERLFYFVTDVIAPNRAAFDLRSAQHDAGGAVFLLERSLRAIRAAERFVRDSQFVAGGRFSVADIAAFTIIRANEAGLDWDRLPSLRRWFDDVRQRPAVQRGLRVFDPKAAG